MPDFQDLTRNHQDPQVLNTSGVNQNIANECSITVRAREHCPAPRSGAKSRPINYVRQVQARLKRLPKACWGQKSTPLDREVGDSSGSRLACSSILAQQSWFPALAIPPPCPNLP